MRDDKPLCHYLLEFNLPDKISRFPDIFLPVWILLCIFRFSDLANILPQPWKGPKECKVWLEQFTTNLKTHMEMVFHRCGLWYDWLTCTWLWKVCPLWGSLSSNTHCLWSRGPPHGPLSDGSLCRACCSKFSCRSSWCPGPPTRRSSPAWRAAVSCSGSRATCTRSSCYCSCTPRPPSSRAARRGRVGWSTWSGRRTPRPSGGGRSSRPWWGAAWPLCSWCGGSWSGPPTWPAWWGGWRCRSVPTSSLGSHGCVRCVVARSVSPTVPQSPLWPVCLTVLPGHTHSLHCKPNMQISNNNFVL